jgi:hypothetical protein
MFLDVERLNAIDRADFEAQDPYPFVNPQGVLTPEGFGELYESLPDLEAFEQREGVERKYGQQSHDRFALEWRPGLDIPGPWKAFIDEIRGDVYSSFLRRLLGVRRLWVRLHWHYTPQGCSVSPHCDADAKFGSQIFYFNTTKDWDPAWGGETLVLKPRHPIPSDSSPDWGEFDVSASAETLDNRSLIFERRGDSWHGVREITAPEGRLRKVFIVVFERPRLSHYFKPKSSRERRIAV